MHSPSSGNELPFLFSSLSQHQCHSAASSATWSFSALEDKNVLFSSFEKPKKSIETFLQGKPRSAAYQAAVSTASPSPTDLSASTSNSSPHEGLRVGHAPSFPLHDAFYRNVRPVHPYACGKNTVTRDDTTSGGVGVHVPNRVHESGKKEGVRLPASVPVSSPTSAAGIAEPFSHSTGVQPCLASPYPVPPSSYSMDGAYSPSYAPWYAASTKQSEDARAFHTDAFPFMDPHLRLQYEDVARLQREETFWYDTVNPHYDTHDDIQFPLGTGGRTGWNETEPKDWKGMWSKEMEGEEAWQLPTWKGIPQTPFFPRSSSSYSTGNEESFVATTFPTATRSTPYFFPAPSHVEKARHEEATFQHIAQGENDDVEYWDLRKCYDDSLLEEAYWKKKTMSNGNEAEKRASSSQWKELEEEKHPIQRDREENPMGVENGTTGSGNMPKGSDATFWWGGSPPTTTHGWCATSISSHRCPSPEAPPHRTESPTIGNFTSKEAQAFPVDVLSRNVNLLMGTISGPTEATHAPPSTSLFKGMRWIAPQSSAFEGIEEEEEGHYSPPNPPLIVHPETPSLSTNPTEADDDDARRERGERHTTYTTHEGHWIGGLPVGEDLSSLTVTRSVPPPSFHRQKDRPAARIQRNDKMKRKTAHRRGNTFCTNVKASHSTCGAVLPPPSEQIHTHVSFRSSSLFSRHSQSPAQHKGGRDAEMASTSHRSSRRKRSALYSSSVDTRSTSFRSPSSRLSSSSSSSSLSAFSSWSSSSSSYVAFREKKKKMTTTTHAHRDTSSFPSHSSHRLLSSPPSTVCPPTSSSSSHATATRRSATAGRIHSRALAGRYPSPLFAFFQSKDIDIEKQQETIQKRSEKQKEVLYDASHGGCKSDCSVTRKMPRVSEAHPLPLKESPLPPPSDTSSTALRSRSGTNSSSLVESTETKGLTVSTRSESRTNASTRESRSQENVHPTLSPAWSKDIFSHGPSSLRPLQVVVQPVHSIANEKEEEEETPSSTDRSDRLLLDPVPLGWEGASASSSSSPLSFHGDGIPPTTPLTSSNVSLTTPSRGERRKRLLFYASAAVTPAASSFASPSPSPTRPPSPIVRTQKRDEEGARQPYTGREDLLMPFPAVGEKVGSPADVQWTKEGENIHADLPYRNREYTEEEEEAQRERRSGDSIYLVSPSSSSSSVALCTARSSFSCTAITPVTAASSFVSLSSSSTHSPLFSPPPSGAGDRTRHPSTTPMVFPGIQPLHSVLAMSPRRSPACCSHPFQDEQENHLLTPSSPPHLKGLPHTKEDEHMPEKVSEEEEWRRTPLSLPPSSATTSSSHVELLSSLVSCRAAVPSASPSPGCPASQKGVAHPSFSLSSSSCSFTPMRSSSYRCRASFSFSPSPVPPPLGIEELSSPSSSSSFSSSHSFPSPSIYRPLELCSDSDSEDNHR